MEILSHSSQLPRGLDFDEFADVVYAVLNEEIYQLLIVDCGWDIQRFREWATALLLQQLTTDHRLRRTGG